MLHTNLIPPADLIGHATGCLDPEMFKAAGREFFNYFRDYANLQPSARVLDIGCGCGRMAIPLLSYLDRTGSFEGIDVDAKSIDWASDHITPSYPNFRFQRADVFNTTYNPTGAFAQHRYRLPFADGDFDFVFLTSVFTHMLPRATAHYLGEISRVLKVGGKVLATFFLLNDESARLVRAGKSHFHFPHRHSTCAVQDRERPEDVVGHDEGEVLKLFAYCGLAPARPVIYGNWSGRDGGVSFQDMIVARKERPAGLFRRLRHAIGSG